MRHPPFEGCRITVYVYIFSIYYKRKLKQRGGVFIQKDHGVLMELKHASLTDGGRIAFECVVNGLRLTFARGNENARTRLHNAADAHAVG